VLFLCLEIETKQLYLFDLLEVKQYERNHICEKGVRSMIERFKRSAKYDMGWINENKMGPNPVWLMEELCEHMNLQKGMKVLDLGCGKAITSIFLAKEFGVQVWATDLWINPKENFKRISDAGVEDLVYPIKAEAHALPYADNFFDAIVSVDAYHYFGTCDLYLMWYLKKLLKPGSEIGIVVPGLMREFGIGLPEELKGYFSEDMFTFHSAKWWRNHWSRHSFADVKLACEVEDGKNIWYASGCDTELLSADINDYLTFIKMIATLS